MTGKLETIGSGLRHLEVVLHLALCVPSALNLQLLAGLFGLQLAHFADQVLLKLWKEVRVRSSPGSRGSL